MTRRQILRHAAVVLVLWPMLLAAVALGWVFPLFILVSFALGYCVARAHQWINRAERQASVDAEFERIMTGG